VFTLCQLTVLHLHCQQWRAAEERAYAAIALATQQGMAVFTPLCSIHRAWAAAMQGQCREGIIQIRQGMAALETIGEEVSKPYYLYMLADIYRRTGQPAEGLQLVVEGLRLIDATSARSSEAELHRLHGELLLAPSNSQSQSQRPEPKTEEAEACFQRALAVARRQQAKSWELRAATSLARLWQQQGKQDEARYLLAEVYGWFTEGFDTADLQEAYALLAAWGR
jgi:predicted ATPase